MRATPGTPPPLCKRRRLRQSELDEVFEHGETLRLQFPKEDLGYVYSSGARECRRPAQPQFPVLLHCCRSRCRHSSAASFRPTASAPHSR